MPRRLLLTLWTRLVCFASISAIFAVAVSVLAGIDGWLMYQTGPEGAVDIGAKVAGALWLGVLAGSVATVLALPYVFWDSALVGQRAERVSRIAARLMVVIGSSAGFGVVLRWAIAVRLLRISNETYI